MENLNLIRKVAWSFFNKSNNLEYDDLFQEAALAYCEALRSYDPDNGAKLTTYAFWCMKNHLINYCKHQRAITEYERFTDSGRKQARLQYGVRNKHFEPPEPSEPTFNEPEPLEEKIHDWPEDCKEIVKIILNNPDRILGDTTNYTHMGGPKGNLKHRLREEGWLWTRIYRAVQEMNSLVQTL